MYNYEQQQKKVYGLFLKGRIKSFYEVAYSPLIVYAERLLGSDLSYMAEDCVQDAVFEAYGKRKEMLSPAHLKQFLYRCVHNNAMSILRKDRSRSRYLSVDGSEAVDDYSIEIIRQETFSRLAFALDQLPPDLREMSRLVFREGLTAAEIAERLGMSVSGVKKRKARLLNALRALVKDDYLMLLVNIFLA